MVALAIDIIDGHDLSNKAHRYLLSKKSKVMLYFSINPSKKTFNHHLTT